MLGAVVVWPMARGDLQDFITPGASRWTPRARCTWLTCGITASVKFPPWERLLPWLALGVSTLVIHHPPMAWVLALRLFGSRLTLPWTPVEMFMWQKCTTIASGLSSPMAQCPPLLAVEAPHGRMAPAPQLHFSGHTLFPLQPVATSLSQTAVIITSA
jgi:hypothetical protein